MPAIITGEESRAQGAPENPRKVQLTGLPQASLC